MNTDAIANIDMQIDDLIHDVKEYGFKRFKTKS